MRRATLLVLGAVTVLILFVVALAVGPRHTNPPVISEPQWDTPATRQLAARACFDCHSNETKWPLYSALPVLGPLIEGHVSAGRKELNFSEWGVPGREQQEGEEAAEKVFEPRHYAEDDVIPQPSYGFMHRKARLSQAEREQLARGLQATLGGEGGGSENHEGERVDDD